MRASGGKLGLCDGRGLNRGFVKPSRGLMGAV